jgi:hypothetical protein
LVREVSNYGRYDDLLSLLDTPLEQEVLDIVSSTLEADLKAKVPSLLAKWLPSENATSKETKRLASLIRSKLKLSSKEYRKTLSILRARIKLVEHNLTNKDYESLNYEAVPSNAGLKYRKAFFRNDEINYNKYLENVKKGKAKINTSTLTPVDIVAKVLNPTYDITLEMLWANLPNYFEGREENSIVVADVSGSMSGKPMATAISLAMYVAERNKGLFHNNFLTFSSNPQLVEIKGSNLREKVYFISKADWGRNTNLNRIFDLLLKTAIKNGLSEQDMPKRLYIVSDMEFDVAVDQQSNYWSMVGQYKNAGYKIPEIVFWNVNSINKTIPVRFDTKGTALVSGSNPSIFKSLLSGNLTSPEVVMLKTVNTQRYENIFVKE